MAGGGGTDDAKEWEHGDEAGSAGPRVIPGVCSQHHQQCCRDQEHSFQRNQLVGYSHCFISVLTYSKHQGCTANI